MPNPRIAALSRQFDEVRAGIDTIEATAARDNRDLTDEEQAQSDTLYTRAEELRGELEPLVTRERNLQATAGVLSTLGLGDTGDRARAHPASSSAPGAPRKWTIHDAGRYFAEYFRAVDPDNPGGRSDRVADFVERWGGRLEDYYRAELGAGAGDLVRAVADQLTTDNAAILPTPILGPVIQFSDGRRPCFDSFTSRPMPAAGKTFTRPRVTQHVQVGEQTTEKTQLASRKMTLASETVSKRTFGGVLNISQQDIDWTDPSIMSLVLADFALEYAKETEGEACDALEALATASPVDVELDAPTVAGILGSLVAAATAVYGTAEIFPDTMWMSLDTWQVLAAMVDSFDRPVFPSLGATAIDLTDLAGMGGAPVGLRPVLAPKLASGKWIVGVRDLVESYEQRKGVLSAPNVALFGVDVAYAGYVAFYGRAEGFVPLTDAD
jgi:hypothetical protein